MRYIKLAKFILALLPSITFATNYYVDPYKGSPTNTGSQTSPWRTLAEVFSSGQTFQAGDVIFLLSGDHGAPIIRGKNTGSVKIQPLPLETPVVSSLRLRNAQNWDISGLEISPKAAPKMSLANVQVLVNIDEESSYNKIQNCNIFSDFIIDQWTSLDWQNKAYSGVWIAGSNNIFLNNSIQNITTGIHTDFHAVNNLIARNVIENFGRDGMQETGKFNTFEYNYILNAFNIDDGNHGDGIQAYGSENMKGTILNGNVVISALKHPNPALYDGRLQGIGLFSSYVDYVVQNNVVMNDHRIGIWLLGGKNCKVINNTVLPNGVHPQTGGGPSGIRLWWTNGKGQPSRNGLNNIVENNIAGEFGLTNPDNSSVCTTAANCSNNLVNQSKALFLNPRVGDLHIVNNAKVVNAGDPTFTPEKDADEVSRLGRPDLVAYEYVPGLTPDKTPPSIPTGVTAIFRQGLGVSLNWLPSKDNRKVAGYEIYRNAIKVARIRVGTSFVDPVTSFNSSDRYTITAFDYSFNSSAPSQDVLPTV